MAAVRLQVIGADAVTGMLLNAARDASGAAKRTALDAAQALSDEWETIIPTGPTGITGSDPMNWAATYDGPEGAGAEAVSSHFVAYFLQHGTSKMAPRADLLGAADAHVDQWLLDLADEVTP